MKMRLPKYYCPHCKRFKKWYQVIDFFDYDDYSFDFRICKHCGTLVVDTVDLFKEFIEYTLRRTKMTMPELKDYIETRIDELERSDQYGQHTDSEYAEIKGKIAAYKSVLTRLNMKENEEYGK